MAKLPEDLQACYPTQGPLADYVTWAHRLTHAPPAIHIASVLPLLSYELVRRGFRLPIYDTLTLWMGVIAPPGSAKNTCLRWARDFSKDFYEGVYGPDLAPKPWISFEGSLQGVLHAISERTDKDLPVIPGVLYHTEASKIFFADEAPSTLCQLYDGEDIERNYRYLQKAKAEGQAAPIVIKAPQLSAVFMTTRAALDRVIQREMLEGGLFSRLLWLQEKLDGLTPFPKADSVGRTELVKRWIGWSRALDGLRAGYDLQLEIGLDPHALQFLEQTLFERLASSMKSESMEASVALRAMPHATRVAAVFAASRLNVEQERHPQTGALRSRIVIGLDDMIRAANFVLRSFQSAMDLGWKSAIQHAPVDTKREMLLKQVKATGRAGLRRIDIYKLFAGHCTKRIIDDLVAELVDAELVVQTLMPATRGRPAFRLFDVDVWDEVDAILKSGGSTTTQ